MRYKFKHKDQVTFTEEGHIYKDNKGKQYTSVTTLIKDYSNPFEGDYYSTYKAVKDTFEGMGWRIWKDYKVKAGGWEGVVDYFNKNRKTHDKEIISRVVARKKYYVDLWEEERDHAGKLGTAAHNDLEQLLLSNKQVKLDRRSKSGNIADISPADLLSIQGFDQGGTVVHPELLLWNKEFMLAGQADVVERLGNIVHISDYKTCKEIQMEPFMDKHMKGPLSSLPDMNYSKFTIQLSTYAWMLEEIGYEIGSLTINHIDRNTGKPIRNYPLAYRRDLVIKMLNDYAIKRIRKSA